MREHKTFLLWTAITVSVACVGCLLWLGARARRAKAVARQYYVSCRNDRMLIWGAVKQYIARGGMTNGHRLSPEDLMPYLPPSYTTNDVVPGRCPAGGVYVLPTSQEFPSCTVHGVTYD